MKTFSREKLLLEPPPLGGVLYLPGFPGGGNKSHDKSPYGNVGTLTGATWTKLPGGLWCLSFDGFDDYVSCGNSASFNLTTHVTLMAWVKLSTVVTSAVISKRVDGGTVGGNYTLGFTNGGVRISAFINNVDFFSTSNHGYSTGVYHHIAITINGVSNVIKHYSDGRQLGNTVTLTETLTANSAQLRVGYGGLGYFNGIIALPKVMNCPVSALEIANIYNQERWLFGV